MSTDNGGPPRLPKAKARDTADFVVRLSGFAMCMGLLVAILFGNNANVRNIGISLIITGAVFFIASAGYVAGFGAGTVWGRTPGSLEADLAVKDEEDRDV